MCDIYINKFQFYACLLHKGTLCAKAGLLARATHGQVISAITIENDVFHIQAKKWSIKGYLQQWLHSLISPIRSARNYE